MLFGKELWLTGCGLCGSEYSFEIREPTYYRIRQSQCHLEQGYKHGQVIIVNGVCEERCLSGSSFFWWVPSLSFLACISRNRWNLVTSSTMARRLSNILNSWNIYIYLCIFIYKYIFCLQYKKNWPLNKSISFTLSLKILC